MGGGGIGGDFKNVCIVPEFSPTILETVVWVLEDDSVVTDVTFPNVTFPNVSSVALEMLNCIVVGATVTEWENRIL